MPDQIDDRKAIGPVTSTDGKRQILATSLPGGRMRVTVKDAHGTYKREFTSAWEAISYWDDQIGSPNH